MHDLSCGYVADFFCKKYVKESNDFGNFPYLKLCMNTAISCMYWPDNVKILLPLNSGSIW